MKRKLQFLKTLLVAVGLSVGASDAWAEDEEVTLNCSSSITVIGPTRYTSNATIYSDLIHLNSYAGNGGAGALAFTLDGKWDVSKVKSAVLKIYPTAKCNANRSGSIYVKPIDAFPTLSGSNLNGSKSYSEGKHIVYSYGSATNKRYTFSESALATIAASGYNASAPAINAYYEIDLTSYIQGLTTKSPGDLIYFGLDVSDWAAEMQFGAYGHANAPKLVITYTTDELHKYTVKAVAGTTTIQNLASGTCAKGADYITYVPKVINYNSKYYVLDDDELTNYKATYTMGSSDAVNEINYTLDESIVGYSDLGSGTTETESNGGHAASNAQLATATVDKGVYKAEISVISLAGGKSGRQEAVYVGGSNVAATTGSAGMKALYFTVPNNATEIYVQGTGTSSTSDELDFVIIRKVADIVDANNEFVGSFDNTTAENGASSSDIVLKDGDAYRITFQNHGSAAANKNHFIVNISNGGSKKASLYADWYDYTNDKGGWGYYFSNPYSANGGTSGNSVDWGTFATEMQDIPVTLNITYQNGKVNIIGTAPKNTNTYYWNYSYGKGVDGATDLTGDVTINLSVCLAWLEILSVEQTAVGATLGANGYTTFASSYPLDLTTANLPAGVKAYKAAVDGTVVRFTELNQTVPANTGILLEGTAGATVSIPVVASGDAVTGNAFLVNTTAATITSNESTYYFAMVKDSNPLKFGKVNGVIIPANKAYLEVPATNFTGTPAPSLTAIFDDGNTTGINTVKNAQFTENGEYYNLAGQRVAQPTKGLYIVNGRKVVVK